MSSASKNEGSKAFTVVLDPKIMDKYDEKYLDAKKKSIKAGKKINKQQFASYFFGKLIPEINVSEFLENC